MIEFVFFPKEIGCELRIFTCLVQSGEVHFLDIPAGTKGGFGLPVFFVRRPFHERSANVGGLPYFEGGGHGTDHFEVESIEGGGVVELEDAQVGCPGREKVGCEDRLHCCERIEVSLTMK